MKYRLSFVKIIKMIGWKKYINNDTIYFFDKILSYLSLYPMKFNNFPNIPVEILNYDIELVNAMIHIASYNIVNDKEKIKEFFNLWIK